MSSFSLLSPPCLPTDILSFNSSAARRAMEGAWETVGERKKVCFSIKRLSGRLRGIHWLFDVRFDDAFLFYELNNIQQQQKCINLLLPLLFSHLSHLLSLPYRNTLCCSLFPLLHVSLLLLSHIITCPLFCKTYFLASADRWGHAVQDSILMAHPSCNEIFSSPWTINFSWRSNCIFLNH